MSEVDQSAPSLALTLEEIDELRYRLAEAEANLEAIRSGMVDALVVQGEGGEQVFTLQGADEPYRIFVENMKEGAVTLDSSGTILYCNKSFASFVVQPLEKVIGTVFSTYFESSPSVLPYDLAAQGRVEQRIKRGVSYLPVLCSATPVTMDGPPTFAVTVTDLSEQKQHELAMQLANAELEGFCYSVSHDMRAPLRSMISSAHFVLEDYGDGLPEDGRTDLLRISASANRLATLMDDLLNYSRLGRQELQLRHVELSTMVQRLVTGIRVLGEDIEWEIEEGIAAECDPRLIEMVLQNLLENAAKFSHRSQPPRIKFGAHPESHAFYVQDNGIGFDMAYEGKLFAPFERLHRQEEYPGTGIGLANVKRIVARHGGEVWATSSPGEGATFFFSLPWV